MQLVLDGVQETLLVVDDRADAVGVCPRLLGSSDQHVAVAVGDQSVPQRQPRLDQLGAARDHRHPRARMDEHQAAPDSSQDRHLP